MSMNRRSLLRGLFAAPAIVAASSLMPVSMKLVAPAIAMPPRLWGDGIHDDTAALQWMFDQASKSGETVHLRDGRYLTSGLVANAKLMIDQCEFIGKGSGSHLLRIEDGASGSQIMNSVFTINSPALYALHDSVLYFTS